MLLRPWSSPSLVALRFLSTLKKKMAPKKAVEAAKPLLGRPSNNLKMGVVGLPNVGYHLFSAMGYPN